MGKRKHTEEVEKMKRKLKRLEKKLKEKESEDSSSDAHTPPGTPLPASDPVASDEDIPEELLGALGKEGEESQETGSPLLPQLATRWSKIMTEGLGKEARERLLKKYPTPENFPAAVAPEMNPEMIAALSEPSLKRDKRIVYRQNLTGKMMSSLGRALSNILKGNINNKELVEQLSDSAKIAAEIYHQDSMSRKFFATSGANLVVKDAIKNCKTDGLLFGRDCGEKIKAAQAIQKTGSQIRGSEKFNKKQQPEAKKGNWKSPLPQQQRPRSGQYRRPLAPKNQQTPRRRPQKATPQTRHPRR